MSIKEDNRRVQKRTFTVEKRDTSEESSQERFNQVLLICIR